MIKKIGILTSGGDAPGMNTCVNAAIRAGINAGKEMYVVYGGYRGLVTGNYVKVDKNFLKDKANVGGTYIGSARAPEFKEEEVRNKAIKELKDKGIDALIVLGGDGSFAGAKLLSNAGINCVGIPATIDNDINSTEYTVGFDTCLNTIVNAIDNIKETTASHDRCAVIEIMGNRCSALTVYSAIATGADFMLTRDNFTTIDDFVEKVKQFKNEGNKTCTVCVAEKFIDSKELADKIASVTGYDTRLTVLGHIQRGGKPSAFERITACRLGVKAIELLEQGIGGISLFLKGYDIGYRDIDEALTCEKADDSEYYNVFNKLK